MGSRRGRKGFTKLELKAYKAKLSLTPDQVSILIGSILGDGTLRLAKGAINANFKVEQGLVQKDNVFWKYNNFKEWVLTPPKISYRYNNERIKYKKSWWFRTFNHPEITYFQKLFYPNGKKIVPTSIGKYLNPLAIAVWIMDDGSFNRGMYDISTYSFTEIEVKHLLKIFKNKFNIKGNYFFDRDKGIRMYFPKSETNKISTLISPYFVNCMRYKLPLLTP